MYKRCEHTLLGKSGRSFVETSNRRRLRVFVISFKVRLLSGGMARSFEITKKDESVIRNNNN